MYLLDTNVVSELRKGSKAQRSVRRWAQACSTTSLYLSAISILELETGILIVARRDRKQGEILRAWMEERVLPAFRGRILPVDKDMALRCAAPHIPNPRSDRDALIAATAILHGLTIVTRNAHDFVIPGLDVVNPWNTRARCRVLHHPN